MSNLLYQLALTMIRSVGPVTAKQMVSSCGSPEAVFREKRSRLLKIPNIGPKTADEITHRDVLIKAEQEMQFIQQHHVRYYFYLDDDYPGRLKVFPDSPVMLFYQGAEVLNHPRTVGIVGTRRPSPYGISACERILEGLRPYEPLIVSGLAYGIDAVSHRKALAEGLPTVGVMGHGLARTYPAAHGRLRKKMTEAGGILTEFPSYTGPEREHFPMRNRIIAALSDALIVVESARKGGSMITAHFAFGYNKDVFAIPGRSEDPLSAGPNFLIKSNVAALAEDAADIAYKMLWEKPVEGRSSQLELFLELDDKEQQVMDLLLKAEEGWLSIDALHYLSGRPASELSGILLGLELRNIVKALPGAKYGLR